MWNLAYIQLLLRKAEKKFASTGIWTLALSFTVWDSDHYPTNTLHQCWCETWHIYSYCWEKLRKSLPLWGFEPWPTASQSEALTTTPQIHCMDVDVKLGIYTATAEKSWKKSLPLRGFELRPSASQSETLTTILQICCVDIDVWYYYCSHQHELFLIHCYNNLL